MLVLLAAVRAEDTHPCPCIPSHLCPRRFVASTLTRPVEACKDPSTVHCCGTSVSQQDQPQLAIVAEHMEEEREIMSVINNALERMSQGEFHRQDKSIGQTDRNKLDCDSKSCTRLEEDKPSSGHHEPSVENENTQSVAQEVLPKNGSSEKLVIIYAEKPSRNNIYFQETSSPQIVLPTKESEVKADSIMDQSSTANVDEPQESESSIDTKVIPGDEKRERFAPHRFNPHRFSPQSKKQRQPVPKESEVKADSIMDKSSTANEDEPQESESSIDTKVFPGVEKQERLAPHRFTPHRSTPQIKKQPHPEHKFNQKERKQSLQQLYAKRRPSPLLSRPKTVVDQPISTDQDEGSIEDIELAASNLDEVQESGIESDDQVNDQVNIQETGSYQNNPTKVLENVEQESPNNLTSSRKLPFRSPPRHLASQPTKPVERPSSKSALELFKRRSKGKIEQPLKTDVNAEEAMMIADVAKAMDEINLQVINDMMKTNFTPTATITQPSRTTRPLKSYNPGVNSRRGPNLPIRSNNQGTNLLPQNADGSLTKDQQIKQNSNPAEGIKEQTKATSFTQRPRFGSQSQRLKPTQAPLAKPAVQPDTEDLPKQVPVSNSSQRRHPFTRIKTRPQAKPTDSSGLSPANPEVTSPPSTPPTNVNRRLPLRQRTRINHLEGKSPVTNEQTGQDVPNQFSSNLPEENTTELQKPEQDLDGSGSNLDPQEFQYQRFAPPAMESGFQPIIQSRQLNIVGPIPGGFHDPALGFNPADDIGLELPPPEENFQPELNTGRNFNGNRQPLSLLPPVFPVAQPPTAQNPQLRSNFQTFSSPPSSTPISQSNFQKFTPIDSALLLPPVQLPVPLNDNRPQQQGDLTHIQKEFNQLKSQYDTLLSRYADTLNIYIGQYKKLINSSPPVVR